MEARSGSDCVAGHVRVRWECECLASTGLCWTTVSHRLTGSELMWA